MGIMRVYKCNGHVTTVKKTRSKTEYNCHYCYFMAMIAHRLGAIFGISCDHSRPYSNIGLMGARKRGRKMRPETTWRSTFHEDMKEIWYSTEQTFGRCLSVYKDNHGHF